MFSVTVIEDRLDCVSSDDWRVKAICDFMLVVTAIAIAFVVLILIPRFRAGRFVHAITRLPKIGPTLERLIAAVGVYRGNPLVLASTFGIEITDLSPEDAPLPETPLCCPHCGGPLAYIGRLPPRAETRAPP